MKYWFKYNNDEYNDIIDDVNNIIDNKEDDNNDVDCDINNIVDKIRYFININWNCINNKNNRWKW